MSIIQSRINQTIELRRHINLDYPDLKPFCIGTWIYGDYGPAPKEIRDKSGINHYNLKVGQFGLSIL